jgi:hypothetical protein
MLTQTEWVSRIGLRNRRRTSRQGSRCSFPFPASPLVAACCTGGRWKGRLAAVAETDGHRPNSRRGLDMGRRCTPDATRCRPLHPDGRTIESTPSRTRTCNLRFRRPMLYPIELWVRRQVVASQIPAWAAGFSQLRSVSVADWAGVATAGGRRWDRRLQPIAQTRVATILGKIGPAARIWAIERADGASIHCDIRAVFGRWWGFV